MPRHFYAVRALLVGSLVLLSGQRATAQFAVIDTAAIAQMVTEYTTQLNQYTEQIRQTSNQYQQIANQVQQIQHAYTQVHQGIQNLQNFNLNYAPSLLGLNQELQAKLNQARQIGYVVSQVQQQAQAIYPKVQSVLTGQDLIAFQQQWAGAQREAAQVGLQVQAIQAQHQDMMEQVTTLMTRASQSQGNLDTQQALAQGQGLIATQLVSVEEQLATQGRLQALKTLEDATMKEATAQALAEGAGTINISGPPAGHILSLSK